MELNDTFCKITGYNRKELTGKNTEIIFATNIEYKSVGIKIYSLVAETGTRSVETRFKHKDGRILNIILSLSALEKDDLTKGVIFTAMDVTQAQAGGRRMSKCQSRS